ncbi:fungal specific transcription factor domain-containing protein [Aspergillus melleus]|uniref:fungal specific transcription factor domain-containing protein n=1 Tax=Aspergillus melleus TaxID=138277 RepID=UPI001E8E5A86|nr:uncharacterized protein LDX57_007144 [Aspergillus melleus]KAH8429482.1 hypothetical protein LDX57_007144 [Aspergillus melleus]
MRRQNGPKRTLACDNDRAELIDAEERQDEPTTKELASRLDRIERQLSDVLSAVSQQSSGSTAPEMPSDQMSTARGSNEPNPAHKNASRSSVPGHGRKEGFLGETSINHALEEIEGYLRHVRELHPQLETSASREESIVVPSSPSSNSRRPTPLEILRCRGISADVRQWSIFLQIFCDEVHVLFPFLHLPSLWTKNTTMWNHYLRLLSANDSEYTADSRFMIAQTWICVAIGKCTASPRSSTQDGKHSSGWSLYRASLDLIGDLLHGPQDCSDQMTVLQTFALMVVYLFRVDANERAEKILAIAISHSHHLGLHRSKVLSTMSAFNSEMFRRLWWCLYVLDRRLAIETGHPILVQDVNVDVPYPQNLGDGWLAAHQDDHMSCLDLSADIDTEVNRDIVTPIPYLVATIHYSRVVGKVWEAVYGARGSNMVPSAPLLNQLENTISRAQADVRPEFSTLNKECPQGYHITTTLPWWRIKQQMVMRIRWLCLRLLIRKPVSRGTNLSGSPENDTTCINIVRDILQEFSQVPEAKAKSAFPFLHYLAGATMISLSLIARKPESKSTLGSLTLQAASSLERYCQNTWVSGKMVRTVWKLNQMVKAVTQSSISLQPSAPTAQRSSTGFASNQLTSEGTGVRHVLQNTYRESNPIQKPSSTARTAAGSPGISNPMDNCDPSAPIGHTQYPQQSCPGAITDLLMTDFDFEQTTQDFPVGTHFSGNQRYWPK